MDIKIQLSLYVGQSVPVRGTVIQKQGHIRPIDNGAKSIYKIDEIVTQTEGHNGRKKKSYLHESHGSG